jgi:hypothetical protein
VRLEGLGQLKKSNELIGNRTRDLPGCSIAPQPTTLPRDPEFRLAYFMMRKVNKMLCVLNFLLFLVKYTFKSQWLLYVPYTLTY